MLKRALAVIGLVILSNGAYAQNHGGKVELGVEQAIAGFDPLVVGVFDTGPSAVAALLFDTLTRLDHEGKVMPRLATSWKASDDFKSWTFTLRPGVTFHDGSSFDAAAVAFNYARMLDPKNHCRCAIYISGIERVDATAPLEVVFHLSNPATNLPELLSPPTSFTVIQSPKAIAEGGEAYNRHPVGTGPFLLKSWSAGDRIVVARNPNYWNPGHPYLDEVTIRPLADAQARFASLLSGESDIIWHDNADDILAAKQNPALAVHDYVGSGATVYAFNMARPPFDDLRVRQALRMALDTKTFAATLLDGLWQPAKDPYGPGSLIHCADTDTPAYDPEKAKALLKAYGKKVSFKLTVTATPRGRAFGQIFQEYWKAVGAEVTLNQVDQTTLVTEAFTRNFDITPWRIADFSDPGVQMYANFHTGSPLNLASYSNPEIDHWLEAARANVDHDKITAAYCRIATLLNHDIPWFWLTENHYFAIAKPALKGIPPQRTNVIDLSEAWWDRKE